VDKSLEAAIKGFRVDSLAGRHAIALRALRTAEFFYLPGAAFPQGLDASPPVLYWAKGLEVWLNGLLRGRLGEIAAKGRLPDLAQVAHRWTDMRGELAPGWRNDLLAWHKGDLYRHLGVDMARQLASRSAVTRNHSLRVLAAVLLVFGEREGVSGVGRWNLGLGRDRVISLANGLVSLAHERNNLTHRAAGDRAVNAPVREVAVRCASGLAAMSRTPGQRPRRT